MWPSGEESKSQNSIQDGIPGWIMLNDIGQLKELVRLSSEKPVIIYKHSTRCGISSRAKSRLTEDFDVADSGSECYFLDLIAHRDISNAIEDLFSIRHESPQLLIIKNGKCIHHVSHREVTAEAARQVI